jgi:nucleotide-binding universal stress UspA family protein/quercetin dioxygenase-like cupin family protein
MPGIQTIVHPTDFSENSQPAFQTACSLARDYDATLYVLHVMMPAVTVLMQGPPPNPLRPLSAQESGARFPWPKAPDPRIRMEHRLAEGDAADEILHFSEAVDANLIIMGTHGKTGLKRLLTGSVAESVLRNAHCGVLVVNTPREQEPPAEAVVGSGVPIDVRPLGPALAAAHTRTLLRTPALSIVYRLVRPGEEISEHVTKGEVIVHCLEGRVAITALGKTRDLEDGNLLHLPAGEPHSFRGIENAALLLTILAPSR